MRNRSCLFRVIPRSVLSSIFVTACAAAVVPKAAAAKNFEKPVAHPAKTYPAHDDHEDEKVAFAADPYDNAEKAKIFSVNFAEHGFLPVFFVVTNEGDQPISIANMAITLIKPRTAKLTPVSSEDIYRRLTNPQGGTRPSSIPIPRKNVKGAITQRERDEIESSQFAAKAVEPHSSQSGFLFFDVEGVSSPLAGANINITGIDDAKGNELMFFEIPMDNSLTPAAKQ